MKNSHKFFSNKDCEYFPCHKGIEPSEFNCIFCYCPLYRIKDCKGNPNFLASGIKDCSACLRPHIASEYQSIIDGIRSANRQS